MLPMIRHFSSLLLMGTEYLLNKIRASCNICIILIVMNYRYNLTMDVILGTAGRLLFNCYVDGYIHNKTIQ